MSCAINYCRDKRIWKLCSPTKDEKAYGALLKSHSIGLGALLLAPQDV